MSYEVNVEELTREAFTPFGSVIEFPPGAKRTSKVEDLYSGQVIWDASDGELEVAFAIDRRRPLIVTRMERHFTSCELLIPIDSDLIIPVATEDNIFDKNAKPKLENIRAFHLSVGQGIFFNNGVWHHQPFPVLNEGRFFVVFKHKTAPDNVILGQLDEEVELKYFQ